MVKTYIPSMNSRLVRFLGSICLYEGVAPAGLLRAAWHVPSASNPHIPVRGAFAAHVEHPSQQCFFLVQGSHRV